MKRYSILIFFIVVMTSLRSCYEDDSSINYKLVNPINIVYEGNDYFELFALDTLQIMPMVFKEGVDDANLSYKWTLYGQNIKPTLLDTTMTLKKEMAFQPIASGYSLVYRITDNDSGLYLERKFSVKVNSSFGTGLIVCHTADGSNSDISLIMSRNFKISTKRDTVMTNLFSRINGRKIEGLITGAVSTQYGLFATLTIATPKAIERVDPRDYTFIDRNGRMFYNDPGIYNAQAVINDANSGYDILNNNGKIYVRSFQQGNRLYGYHFNTPDMSATRITKVHKPYWYDGICFDELGGRFLALNNMSNRFSYINAKDLDQFKWNLFQDYECLQMFDGNDKRVHAVMKQKSTGKYFIYSIRYKGYNGADDMVANRIYELNPEICPEIDKARFFASTEYTHSIYYATDTKLYAVSISVPDNLLTTLEYTTLPDEEITYLYSWSNYRVGGYIDYTNPNPDAEQKVLTAYSQNRMLVISTYNATTNQGYVNTVALINQSRGNLEQNRKLHNRFSGFGKILITTLQEK